MSQKLGLLSQLMLDRLWAPGAVTSELCRDIRRSWTGGRWARAQAAVWWRRCCQVLFRAARAVEASVLLFACKATIKDSAHTQLQAARLE